MSSPLFTVNCLLVTVKRGGASEPPSVKSEEIISKLNSNWWNNDSFNWCKSELYYDLMSNLLEEQKVANRRTLLSSRENMMAASSCSGVRSPSAPPT